MSGGDFDFEVEPGLPEPLPAGEHVLWRGAPDWWRLAKHSFHARKVAIYFIAIAAVQMTVTLVQGGTLASAFGSASVTLGLGAGATAILTLLAWFYARSTVYVLTEKRLVLRFGLALPMSVNLPYRLIASAALHVDGKGLGNIRLELVPSERMSFLALWPNAAPWRVSRPAPTLIGITSPEGVAEIVRRGLEDTLPASQAASSEDAHRSTGAQAQAA